MAKHEAKHVARHEAPRPGWRDAPPEEQEETLEPVTEKAEKPNKKGKRAFPLLPVILAAVLVVLIGGAFVAGSMIGKGERNLPNVHIGEIDVGKLTKEETLEKLRSEGWTEKTEAPLVVTTIGGQTVNVDPVRSGLVLSSENAATAAFSYGHSGNAFGDLLAYFKCALGGADANEVYSSVSDEYIDSCISEAEAKVQEYMGTELYSIDAEASVMRMKKGFGQLKLDTVQLKSDILSALKEGKSELVFTGITGELTCPDFAAIHKELEREPENAYYSDDNRFTVTDEVVGCRFDTSEATTIWVSAQPGEQVEIPLDITVPEITGEMLRGKLFRDLLGAMTTEFPASAPDRVSNVALCGSKIDGTILYPGDIFSYNDTVGPRTKEAGFLVAPAYVDGEVKDEVGGGACQVASTIYAATLFAFLETVDRTCHQFPVSYMQMGTDATVAWPEDGNIVDFKFKNNKNFPIKIVVNTDTENKKITVEIWGTLEDGDYMPIEFDNRYSWVNTYDRTIDPAYPDREGYVIKLSIVGDMYTVTDDDGNVIATRTLTHRLVYDSSGNLVEDKIVNKFVENINGPGMDTYYIHP